MNICSLAPTVPINLRAKIQTRDLAGCKWRNKPFMFTSLASKSVFLTFSLYFTLLPSAYTLAFTLPFNQRFFYEWKIRKNKWFCHKSLLTCHTYFLLLVNFLFLINDLYNYFNMILVLIFVIKNQIVNYNLVLKFTLIAAITILCCRLLSKNTCKDIFF